MKVSFLYNELALIFSQFLLDSDAVIESKKIYNELKRKRGDFIQKVKTYFERSKSYFV